jgi:exonuclease VII large subunit
LERGYSITLGAGGALVRNASAVAAGENLVTRFCDGRVESQVTGILPLSD